MPRRDGLPASVEHSILVSSLNLLEAAAGGGGGSQTATRLRCNDRIAPMFALKERLPNPPKPHVRLVERRIVFTSSSGSNGHDKRGNSKLRVQKIRCHLGLVPVVSKANAFAEAQELRMRTQRLGDGQK